jgi:methylated-DNA-protein-cysteine methyltransferase related protein
MTRAPMAKNSLRKKPRKTADEPAKAAASVSPTHRLIHDVVRRIPRGRVATYGQVADLAGLPRQPRLVGYVMNALPPGTAIPWHRVVNAKGEVSARSDGLGGDQIQAQLLAREGVRFIDGRIPLERYRWEPAPRQTI